MTTDYHSQYWAHALTLKSASDSIQNLSRSIANARVDLNPHQVDAALFAFRSPLAKGTILADEVGLGKTIEAGLVIAQRWAERRRKILLILPATLRKQWQQEMEEKFYLPTVVLESRNFNQLLRDGHANPFDQDGKIVACSYHFASAKRDEIRRVGWDLVVIDEAHRLRNVYKTQNKMARNISDATSHAAKLLLTATPLQNSLMELYGLVSIIDPHVFGGASSFREKFVRNYNEERRNELLRERLKPLCSRTLRKQVLEYIRFTQRVPITQDFLPTDEEHQLYTQVSAYLQREILLALPSRQRMLMTMVLRKLLASSTFAIGGTLRRLVRRLENLLAENEPAPHPEVESTSRLPGGTPTAAHAPPVSPLSPAEETPPISSLSPGGEGRGEGAAEADTDLLDNDFESIDEVQDEWDEEEQPPPEPEIDPALIRDELAELMEYADLADRIRNNAKGEALIGALKTAFDRATSLGARRKAVIFTESRRTQEYLFELLTGSGVQNSVLPPANDASEQTPTPAKVNSGDPTPSPHTSPYTGRVVLLNGTNTDPHSRAVYESWLKRHEGEDTVTGSRAVDTKAAIVEEFRNRATIMIATEAGAEGINLQFCSLVVNYDLPWNPQRIEQRIGRCHRYGQQHDVVVVNFLNRRNEADQRVFQLLAEKFSLFDGVFGASDEVLGALESGVDIERRIAQVYQDCRTSEEIQAAFDRLQSELEEQVASRMAETRQALLDNFDEDVHARLRFHRKEATATLSDRERWLLHLTRHELGDQATFHPRHPQFFYTGPDARHGSYCLDWKLAAKNHDIFYRTGHPLAGLLIQRAKERTLPVAHVTFDYQSYGARIAPLEKHLGTSGWLEVSKLTVESIDTEEFLLFAAVTDDRHILDAETCEKLLKLPATVSPSPPAHAPGSGVQNSVLPATDELREHNLTPAKVNSGDPTPTPLSAPPQSSLTLARRQETARCLKKVDERNGAYFDDEVTKLERWSDDLKLGLEREIKDLDQQIRDIRREARAATALTEKLAGQKKLKAVESERNRKRRELYDAQDGIDQQRDELITKIERQLTMHQCTQPLYIVHWTLE